ncbi:hypothetical protein HanXRQr2_Chr07g0297781 [Helianthus annuus]|uniref:Uncharacterized protein n=1 Tax=Helianthus annuus TaxID=4232 RepID=A0A9K3ILL4_HELAN|nr:hypothetical protein HanXRQr2_Chr07g0297781 [Helianthus annuus]
MFSGVERHASFAKVNNFSISENLIFLNHIANGFQGTQMVYERFILNIPVLQNKRECPSYYNGTGLFCVRTTRQPNGFMSPFFF